MSDGFVLKGYVTFRRSGVSPLCQVNSAQGGVADR